MPKLDTPCPCCGKRKVEYVENGGVVFFHRVRIDKEGKRTYQEGSLVVVVGVPVWACMTPGCMWGRPVDAAAPLVDKLAEAQEPDAVRLFI
jgi:hypothetical protein